MARDNLPNQPPQGQPPNPPQPQLPQIDTGGAYQNPYFNAVYNQTQRPMSQQWQQFYGNMNQAMMGQGPMAFQNPTAATSYVNRQLHTSPQNNPYLNNIVAQQQRGLSDQYNANVAPMAKLASGQGQRNAMNQAAQGYSRAAGELETNLRYQDYQNQQQRLDQMAALGGQMDATASNRYLGQMQNQTNLLGQQTMMDKARMEGLGRLAGQYSQDAQHEAAMDNALQRARISIRPAMAAQDWQRFTYLNEWPYREAAMYAGLVNDASGGYGSMFSPSDPFAQAIMGGMGGAMYGSYFGGG